MGSRKLGNEGAVGAASTITVFSNGLTGPGANTGGQGFVVNCPSPIVALNDFVAS